MGNQNLFAVRQKGIFSNQRLHMIFGGPKGRTYLIIYDINTQNLAGFLPTLSTLNYISPDSDEKLATLSLDLAYL